jgi:hypothetical protein
MEQINNFGNTPGTFHQSLIFCTQSRGEAWLTNAGPINCPKGESDKAGAHKPLRRVGNFVAAKSCSRHLGICRPSGDIQFLRRGNWRVSGEFVPAQKRIPVVTGMKRVVGVLFGM